MSNVIGMLGRRAVLAIAPALSAFALVSVFALVASAAALAALGNPVTARPDHLLDQFGRASVQFWQGREPNVSAPALDTQEASTDSMGPAHQQEPRRYGRAGGYVGLDVLRAPVWSTATGMEQDAKPVYTGIQ